MLDRLLTLIGFACFLGTFYFLIRLIVALIKRQPKKTYVLGIVACFLLFGVSGMFLPKPSSGSSHTSYSSNTPQEVVEQNSAAKQQPAPEPEKPEEKPEDTEETPAVSYESAVQLLETSVKMAYDDCYTFEYDENNVVIGAWKDGVATGAVFAQEGNQECLDAWNTMRTSVRDTSKKFYEILCKYGYDNVGVTINVVNDQNHTNTLLTVYNGLVTYDCVND
jgi:hypothetical protein